MFKRGDKLYSILHNRCPRCQEGRFYKVCNPYRLGRLFAMHSRCDRCGLRYLIETGFWYGAMYVNYALGVAITVAVFVITSGLLGLDLQRSLLIAVGALVVLTPVMLKWSRLIWISFFVRYDPKAIEDFKNHKARQNA